MAQLEYIHGIHNIVIGESFPLWTCRADPLILYYQVRFAAGILRSNCIYDLRVRTLHWMLGLRDDDISVYPGRSEYLGYFVNLGGGSGKRDVQVLDKTCLRRCYDLNPIDVDFQFLQVIQYL